MLLCHARCGSLQPGHWFRWQPCGSTWLEAHVLASGVRGSGAGPPSGPIYFQMERNHRVSTPLHHHHRARPTMSLAMLLAITLALILPLSIPCFAQRRAERTIDEIKVEAVHRAEVGQYPLIGLDPGDVKEAFSSIHTKDKDDWAAGFMAVADRYMNEGKSLEKTDLAKANADYIRAWRLYSFGRWPIPASPAKQRPYAKALQAFLPPARSCDPPAHSSPPP